MSSLAEDIFGDADHRITNWRFKKCHHLTDRIDFFGGFLKKAGAAEFVRSRQDQTNVMIELIMMI
jgi:hypothetical protein